MMECNIDDMNPEFYEHVSERLFNAKAYDVFYTPIIMKKSRPAIKLSVIYCLDYEAELEKIIFRETTTLGIRKYMVQRSMLRREFLNVETKFGTVKVKNSYYGGELVNSKPEYEDCKNISKDNNIPINKIYKEVEKKLNK